MEQGFSTSNWDGIVARLGSRVIGEEVGAWVVEHALYSLPSFRVDHVHLYSSVIGQRGSKYRIEASFPLDQ